MHEAGDANIQAIVLSIVVIFVVYQLIKRQLKAAEARNQEILKLQRLAAEEVAWAEWQAAEEFKAAKAAEQFNSSPPVQAIKRPNLSREQTERGQRPIQKIKSSTQASIQSPSAAVANFSVAGARPHEVSDPGSSRGTPGPGFCIICTAPTNKQCAGCKAVKYCSQQCQVKHWFEGHKHECQKSEKQLRSSNAESITLSNSDNLQPANPTPDRNAKKALLEEKLPSATVNTLQYSGAAAMNGSLPESNTVLFPYDQFVKYFTWNKLELAPCGLINCGNSCFANVVLQCLTYTRPLTAYLLEQQHLKECQQNGWCFMCELQKHVLKVRKSQTPFSAVIIVSKMCDIGNHMDYGRQEDAHEFMRLAIDTMQTICLAKVGGEKSVNRSLSETTFIQHVFGGRLQSQVRCLQCHHESYKYENMMDLAVEIQGSVETLEDALTRFTAPEWLDDDNKYKCDRCNGYVKAWKRLVIHEAPNILTIALKRFQSGKFGKLNKRVIFPNFLDMIPFMSKEGDKPPVYELYGVVVHIDTENASFFGHYVCYIKDFHGVWYEIDDDKVKRVDMENVMQQRAYMLLYQRCRPRQAPLLSGHVNTGSANFGVPMLNSN